MQDLKEVKISDPGLEISTSSSYSMEMGPPSNPDGILTVKRVAALEGRAS